MAMISPPLNQPRGESSHKRQQQLEQEQEQEEKNQPSIWSLQRAGGPLIFFFITIAYVVQTELTQAVQRTYHKPYFLLYLTHSGYAFILPIHLIILKFLKPHVRTNERIEEIKKLLIKFHQFYHHNNNNNNDDEDRIQKSSSSTMSKRNNDSSSDSPRRRHGHDNLNNNDAINGDLRPLLTSSSCCCYYYCSSLKQEEDFPTIWMIKLSIKLTLFLTIPALCWYSSVPFADMTSITAIFNTNSCFTYVLSVWLLESETYQVWKTVGVVGSFLGALMISWSERPDNSNLLLSTPDGVKSGKNPQFRWIGISLALLGSIGYALYEVWYKKFIVLPDYLFSQHVTCTHIASNNTPPILEEIILDHQYNYHGIDTDDDTMQDQEFTPVTIEEAEVGKQYNLEESYLSIEDRFHNNSKSNNNDDGGLLYTNTMTTMVGLVTISLLWIPIPIFDYLGIEKFQPVQDWSTAFMILGIVIMGVTFNAGFMVLLGLWGPVISSVGNLCALVLIAIVDKSMIGNNNDEFFKLNLDGFSFFGSLFILVGFSVVIFFEKSHV